MKLDKATAELALIIFRKIEKDWEAYEADCDEESKSGYRPSHCFHGRSLWTENDIPCGYCEDYGYYSFNRMAYREVALGEAQQAMAKMMERMNAYIKMSALGAPIQLADFNDWICEPVTVLGWVPHSKR